MLVHERKHRSNLCPTSLSFPELGTAHPKLVFSFAVSFLLFQTQIAVLKVCCSGIVPGLIKIIIMYETQQVPCVQVGSHHHINILLSAQITWTVFNR